MTDGANYDANNIAESIELVEPFWRTLPHRAMTTPTGRRRRRRQFYCPSITSCGVYYCGISILAMGLWIRLLLLWIRIELCCESLFFSASRCCPATSYIHCICAWMRTCVMPTRMWEEKSCRLTRFGFNESSATASVNLLRLYITRICWSTCNGWSNTVRKVFVRDITIPCSFPRSRTNPQIDACWSQRRSNRIGLCVHL